MIDYELLAHLDQSDAAPDVPDRLQNGTCIGECHHCGARFEYGRIDLAHDVDDDCPNCGSIDWGKWGHRTTDGVHVPRSGIDAIQYLDQIAASEITAAVDRITAHEGGDSA